MTRDGDCATILRALHAIAVQEYTTPTPQPSVFLAEGTLRRHDAVHRKLLRRRDLRIVGGRRLGMDTLRFAAFALQFGVVSEYLSYSDTSHSPRTGFPWTSLNG